MIKGNKGEWSEAYTFLKLLADGKLYAADSNLQKISDIYYPLIKVLREEVNGSKRNYVHGESIRIVDGASGEVIKEVPKFEFINEAEILLTRIQQEKGAFSVSEVEAFLQGIDVYSLKARSNDKRDITIVVHDQITGLNPELGFSIKSRLGSPSTLLNSNKDATNFIYRVEGGITSEEIADINSIESSRKIRDRINEIYKKGYSLVFKDMANSVFKMNLQLIDSCLPLIIGQILLDFNTSTRSSMEDLVNQVSLTNPCNFDNTHNHRFYNYKVKSLLTDVALGMTPTKVWNGLYDATGGYIIVREDGELLCYHVYNRNEFQDYLLKNTSLDSPSSTRHQYGNLYEEDGEVLFKLNLQVRFRK